MIKTGENQTGGKENDSIQESKTKATTHVATASVVQQPCIISAKHKVSINVFKFEFFYVTSCTNDRTLETLLRWLVIDFEISGI
jgi:hypothetical protein